MYIKRKNRLVRLLHHFSIMIICLFGLGLYHVVYILFVSWFIPFLYVQSRLQVIEMYNLCCKSDITCTGTIDCNNLTNIDVVPIPVIPIMFILIVIHFKVVKWFRKLLLEILDNYDILHDIAIYTEK